MSTRVTTFLMTVALAGILAVVAVPASLYLYFKSQTVGFYGRVVDASGHPVAGAIIEAAATGRTIYTVDLGERSGTRFWLQSVSDADGRFAIREGYADRYSQFGIYRIRAGTAGWTPINHSKLAVPFTLRKFSGWNPAAHPIHQADAQNPVVFTVRNDFIDWPRR